MIDIAILTYPGAQQAAVLGMTDLFVAADVGVETPRDPASSPSLAVSQWQVADGGMARADTVGVGHPAPSICILPPTMAGPRDNVDPVLIRWLRERQAAGAVLASVCLGAFVLGETGLLDPPGRAQSYYSGFSPHTGHQDEAILQAQEFLHDNAGRIVDVPTLAARAGLEERTFLRRFQKATGQPRLNTGSACASRMPRQSCAVPALPSTRSVGTSGTSS